MLSRTGVVSIRRLVLLLIVVAIPVRDAAAHELSDRAWPAPDSVVDEAPEAVEIAFPELLADEGNRLVVQSQRGEIIADREPAVLRDAASSSLSIDLPTTLADGTYIVSWTARHADGRSEDGSYAFTVRVGEQAETTRDGAWLAWVGTAIGLGVIAAGGWWLVRRNRKRDTRTMRA